MNLIDLFKPREKSISYTPLFQLPVIAICITVLLFWNGSGGPALFITMCFINLLGLFMIHTGTILLDKHISWKDSFSERLLYQLGFCWLLPIFLCWYFTNDLFCLQRMDLSAVIGSNQMYVQIFSLPLLINCGYLCYYLLQLFNNDMLKHDEEDLESEYLKNEGVKVSDILLVQLKGRDTFIALNNGDTVVLKFTNLKFIEKQLGPDRFYRINRNYIISRAAYISHQRHNRGLLIFLHPKGSDPVVVPRYKAKELLNFLRKSVS